MQAMRFVRLHFHRLLLGFALSAMPAVSQAAAASFVEELSAQERAETGIDRLSPEQLSALDHQVGRELALARQGDVIAFARTFTTRRPPSEYAAAGLDALTPEEAARLDALVAHALASRPLAPATRSRTSATAVETVTNRAQWHGQISATYGRGSGGREFYGGSVTSSYDDPDRGFAAALTLSRYEGDGFFFHDGRGCRSGLHGFSGRGWAR